MATYNQAHHAVLDQLLQGHPLVRPGKMFGYPAYYVGKKLCICLYEDGVAVRLPAASVARLFKSDPHVSPFRPMGRATMRQWVLINLSRSEDYVQYEPVFDEAIRFVLAEGSKAA